MHALPESINLPIISRPICRDGMALVDGGILDNVPGDVLVSQQANVVIAIDLAAQLLLEFADNRPDTDQMTIPTVAQTARVQLVQDRNNRSRGRSAADLVIEPDVAAVDLADFTHAAETAALGWFWNDTEPRGRSTARAGCYGVIERLPSVAVRCRGYLSRGLHPCPSTHLSINAS